MLHSLNTLYLHSVYFNDKTKPKYYFNKGIIFYKFLSYVISPPLTNSKLFNKKNVIRAHTYIAVYLLGR